MGNVFNAFCRAIFLTCKRWILDELRFHTMSIFLFTLHLTLLQTDGFDNKVTIYPVYGILTYDGFNYFTSTQTIWSLWNCHQKILQQRLNGSNIFFQKVHCFKSVWKSFSSLVIIRSIDQAFEINRSPLKIFMPIVQNSMSEALNFAYISPDITHAVGTNIELPSVKEKLTLHTISLEIL